MTVPGPASWLADGIVSHNSGAIEQDSDLILLIYREEVYDKNTTRKGIADIIIVSRPGILAQESGKPQKKEANAAAPAKMTPGAKKAAPQTRAATPRARADAPTE